MYIQSPTARWSVKSKNSFSFRCFCHFFSSFWVVAWLWESDVWWYRSRLRKIREWNLVLSDKVWGLQRGACPIIQADPRADYMYWCRGLYRSGHIHLYNTCRFGSRAFDFGWMRLPWPNLTWSHDIAEINTRKIITISISQNFVLANNGNNKVKAFLL